MPRSIAMAVMALALSACQPAPDERNLAIRRSVVIRVCEDGSRVQRDPDSGRLFVWRHIGAWTGAIWTEADPSVPISDLCSPVAPGGEG